MGLGRGLGLGFARHAGGGGGSSGPAWLTGAPTLLGDITVNNTLAGTVSMPTNGWVLRIPTNLGAVSSCDPTKVILTVKDFGWGTDGSAVEWTRTVTGLARVAKPYPDQATYTDADQAAGTVEIALDQQLYNSAATDSTGRAYKSTIASIIFMAGFLNGSGIGSYTGSITRGDSANYPTPIWKHADHPDQRIGSAGYIDFEWTCVDERAQKGSQLACMEAWARVGGTDGPIARASSMTDSRWTADGTVPRGAPAPMHVPVFSTRIYGTGLADGAGSLRSRAKPWIGPEVNSYDAGVGEAAISFNLMADTPFVKDVAGVYAPLYAYVNQDGNGLLGTDLTGLSASSADPGTLLSYQTLAKALTAARTYNKNSRGHDDCDGLVIRLRAVAGSAEGADAGSYSVYEAYGNITATNLLPVVIEADTLSDAVRMRGVKFDGTAIARGTKSLVPKLKFRNIKFDSVGAATGGGGQIICNVAPAFTGSPTQIQHAYIVFENCDLKGNSSDLVVATNSGGATGTFYNYRTRFEGTGLPSGFANWWGQAVSIGSSYIGTASPAPDMTCSLACYGSYAAPTTFTTVISGPQPRQSIMFNSRFDIGVTNALVSFSMSQTAVGMGIVGCLFRDYGTLISRLITIRADADVTPMSNLVVQNCSTPIMNASSTYNATRWNMIYNSFAFVRVDKTASMRFNAFAKTATKDSTFSGEALSGTAWSNSTAYAQGALVYDPGTGASITTANVYQALRTVPAGTALSDASYWFNAGVWGSGATGAQPRRTGNKRFRIGVGNLGNVNGGSVQGNAGDTTPGANNSSWLSDNYWPGSGTKWGGANPLTYFVNDNLTASPGLGDYHPNPAGELIGMVPAGLAVAPFDYLGTARKNDGTGAAGALEAA